MILYTERVGRAKDSNRRKAEEMSQGANRFKSRKRRLSGNAGRSCRGKTRYRTHEHAVEALVGIRYRTEGNRDGFSEDRIPVRVYECLEPACNGGYHLTSRPLRESQFNLTLVGA
jgi:hypothetical protein